MVTSALNAYRILCYRIFFALQLCFSLETSKSLTETLDAGKIIIHWICHCPRLRDERGDSGSDKEYTLWSRPFSAPVCSAVIHTMDVGDGRDYRVPY